MSDKSFKIAGVSKLAGSYKVRFANDMTRVKVLAKTGHTEIELIDLPKAMTKPELVTHLKTTELYNRAEFKQAIDAADEKYNGSATVKVARVTVKPSKAPAKRSTKASTKATVTA
jgi:hypothetical protein